MKKILDIFSAFLIILSVSTVLITAYLDGYEVLLTSLTEEGNFFEWMSVMIFFMIAIYGIVFLWKHGRGLTIPAKLIIGGISCSALFGAMEEISWGQQLFNFESPEYFIIYNYQAETNLHNFMPPGLLDSIIYLSIYALLVYIPLFIILLAKHITFLGQLKPWVAPPGIILIILFSASFQAYFYDDILMWLDMALLLGGMILFGIAAALKRMSARTVVLYLFLCATTALFIHSYVIFDIFNMQYEIREVFIGLGFLYYLVFLTQKSGNYQAWQRTGH